MTIFHRRQLYLPASGMKLPLVIHYKDEVPGGIHESKRGSLISRSYIHGIKWGEALHEYKEVKRIVLV